MGLGVGELEGLKVGRRVVGEGEGEEEGEEDGAGVVGDGVGKSVPPLQYLQTTGHNSLTGLGNIVDISQS